MGFGMTPLKWLTFCIAIAIAGPTKAVNNNLYLVVLAGQSNMVGKGDVRDLPLNFPKNGFRIWNFTNAYNWELAKEPLHSNYNQIDTVSRNRRPGVGPALAMADAFAAKYPQVDIGLIPCAKGGSSIEEWQHDLSRSSLYGSCLYRQKSAEQQGKIRALVFWQGGGNGKDQEAAENWGKNFKTMVEAWRADIGDPDLPVILLTLKPGTKQILKKSPYRDVVREQQLSVQVRHLTKIETTGYDYFSDDIHLTTAGQLALGPVIAKALPSP
jgi:Carbohydrate esterase, sialic acid-specific acetylesterase